MSEPSEVEVVVGIFLLLGSIFAAVFGGGAIYSIFHVMPPGVTSTYADYSDHTFAVAILCGVVTFFLWAGFLVGRWLTDRLS